MSSDDKSHLSAEEISFLVQDLEAAPHPNIPRAVRISQQAHLASCSECASSFANLRNVQVIRRSLGKCVNSKSSDHCADEGLWLEVAAGIADAEESRKFVIHAAECDHCGRLLREASEDLSGATTSQEHESLQNLESARLEWHRALGSRMAQSCRGSTLRPSTSVSTRSKWFFSARDFSLGLRLAFVAVTIALLLTGFWLSTRMVGMRLASVNDLLAQAYAQRRTMDLRFGQAGNAPVGATSDPGTSRSRPQTLVKAEEQIARALKLHPNDPLWLQARARADLLEGNPQAATQNLETALNSRPTDLSIEIDLASAYSESGFSAKATDLLEQVLGHNPNNSVALFNRAKMLQNQHMQQVEEAIRQAAQGDRQGAMITWRKAEGTRQEAIADLSKYLKIEPSGPWADEAMRDLTAYSKQPDTLDAASPRAVPPEYFLSAPGFDKLAPATKK